jgi:hypothetical protein
MTHGGRQHEQKACLLSCLLVYLICDKTGYRAAVACVRVSILFNSQFRVRVHTVGCLGPHIVAHRFADDLIYLHGANMLHMNAMYFSWLIFILFITAASMSLFCLFKVITDSDCQLLLQNDKQKCMSI